MSTRVTALGLTGLLAGLALLFFVDGTASTVIGFALLGGGAVIMVLANLFGVRVRDQQRASEAAAHRDAQASAAMQRASETGRWPRVIGGG